MITVSHTFGGNFIIPPAVPNLRRYGIPPGGPADPLLSALALLLAQSEICLEITAPITLTSSQPTQITIAAPPGSQVFPEHPTFALALIPLLPKKPLKLQAPNAGFRFYLSWPGLLSPSNFPSPLTTAATLPVKSFTNPKLQAFNSALIPPLQQVLRYIPTDHNQFEPIPTQVTPHISRIGTRLSPFKPYPQSPPLPRSEPSIQGAIQLTPDNQFLIHGPDGPTLGGYPKIGTIIEADLSVLAQLRPGQSIELHPCSLSEAILHRQSSHQSTAQTVLQVTQALRIIQNQT